MFSKEGLGLLERLIYLNAKTHGSILDLIVTCRFKKIRSS